jgi:radical SAM protein with 4Fe4S-binding SPASM domain
MFPTRSWLVPRLVSAGIRARHSGRRRAALALFETALLVEPRTAYARRTLDTMRMGSALSPQKVRFVVLGTTGTCNASCVHCPTGKAETAHNPRTPMKMELFHKIIDGLVEDCLPVEGHIAFGLFGDALVDPFVIERAEYMRKHLPGVTLSVNTNGAAFNPAKHAKLQELATVISLHCESIDPATYDELMQPLRAERVFPKFEQMIKTFPGKLDVAVPVSRRNVGEVAAIRDYFLSRGARSVNFAPLMSRSAEDRTIFNQLALAPHRIRCFANVADDLIVDCDGTVVQCCQDFQRLEPIGDLRRESLVDVLGNLQRERFRRQMQQGAHDERTACTRCFADLLSPDFPFDHPTQLAS